MVPEEHNRNCSNSGGGGDGGRRWSTGMPNSVPLRGLSVVQLEKMRLENQQKRDSSPLTIHYADFRPNLRPRIPPPPLPLPPLIDLALQNSVPGLSNYNFQDKKRKFCCDDLNLHYKSRNAHIRLPFDLMQRSLQFQQSSSSLMMEPPSNQSYHGISCIPLLPEEDQMVGMKRPLPLPLSSSSGTDNYLLPYGVPITLMEGPASHGGFSDFREGHSTSGGNSEPYQIQENTIKQSQVGRPFFNFFPLERRRDKEKEKEVEATHSSNSNGNVEEGSLDVTLNI